MLPMFRLEIKCPSFICWSNFPSLLICHSTFIKIKWIYMYICFWIFNNILLIYMYIISHCPDNCSFIIGVRISVYLLGVMFKKFLLLQIFCIYIQILRPALQFLSINWLKFLFIQVLIFFNVVQGSAVALIILHIYISCGHLCFVGC